MTMAGQIDIKRAVSGGKEVTFRFYRNGQLWYATEHDEIFPVPVSDLGDATALRTEKALLMMRYMRKWNESLKDG